MNASKIEDIEIQLFLETLHYRYGYDFSNYAKKSLKRRILNLKRVFGVPHIADLISPLLHDHSLLEQVINQLSVPVSEMFRNPSVYCSLRKQVLPVLKTFPHINIWLPGCASGEEVYSVAIMLQEEGLLEIAQIYATDINNKALKTAEAGIYSAENLQRFNLNYKESGGKSELSNYYHKAYQRLKINRPLQNKITFAYHNLVSDGVFCEFHLIFCQNVFIYFNSTLQQQVLKLFSASLSRGGFLCLGDKKQLSLSDNLTELKMINENKMILKKPSYAQSTVTTQVVRVVT